MADLTDYEIEQLEFRISQGKRVGHDTDDVLSLIDEIRHRRAADLNMRDIADLKCLRTCVDTYELHRDYANLLDRLIAAAKGQ